MLYSEVEKVLLIDPPHDFTLKAEVVAVLPYVGDKVLLLQRLDTHPQANLWVPPGGKVMKGESLREAASRELFEETGIVAKPQDLIEHGKYFVRYPNGDFIFYLFSFNVEDDISNIKFRDQEHQSFCICSIEVAKKLALSPGMEECFEIAKQN